MQKTQKKIKQPFSIIPLKEIEKYCQLNYLQKSIPKRISQFIIYQGLAHNATDIHLDYYCGYSYLYFRIDGFLKKIAKFKVDTTNYIIDELVSTTHQNPPINYNVWSGKIPSPVQAKTSLLCHIISFTPVNSIVIRLSPLDSPTPSLTSNAGIDKKIFIWQMGKVGSTSVFSSLKPFTKGYDRQHIDLDCQNNYLVHNNIVHTHSAQPIFNLLHQSKEEFVIISLVRDLLSRNISTIFQSMCDPTPTNVNFIASENEFKDFPFDHQKELISKKLKALNLSQELTSWYKDLFKSHYFYPDIDRYFVDVYSKPFDQTKGFQVYHSKTPRIKMIIIRLEDLNNLEKEIGGFLAIDCFKLVNDNISKNKWYSDLYNRFKRQYQPTKYELDSIYNSKFMNYFYSQQQIDNFKKSWEHTF